MKPIFLVRVLLLALGMQSAVCNAIANSAIDATAKDDQVVIIKIPQISPPRFWKQLKEVDTSFDAPAEPLVKDSESYSKKLSVFVKGHKPQDQLLTMLREGKVVEVLKSSELKKNNGQTLAGLNKIVTSPKLKCGYSAEQNYLAQIGNAIVGSWDFPANLTFEVLSAFQTKDRGAFKKRNQQVLNYFMRNFECSYSLVQFFINQGSVISYYKVLAQLNLNQNFRAAIQEDLEKFKTWYQSKITIETFHDFYPRDFFAIFSSLYDPNLTTKEITLALSIPQGADALGNSVLPNLSNGFAGMEGEKDYEKMKKDPETALQLIDFLDTIRFPSELKLDLKKDARLLIDMFNDIRKNPATYSEFDETGMGFMKQEMARVLFEELDLKSHGLKSANELVKSKALTKLIFKIMENPALRYQMRMKFAGSEYAQKYFVYLSLENIAQSALIGSNQKFISNQQKLQELMNNLLEKK